MFILYTKKGNKDASGVGGGEQPGSKTLERGGRSREGRLAGMNPQGDGSSGNSQRLPLYRQEAEREMGARTHTGLTSSG